MTLLYRLLQQWMRATEERMIRRLLRQRDEARAQIDHYRRLAGMKLGEFCPNEPTLGDEK